MSRSRIALRWLPALAWMGIIFWLSGSPQPPGGIELPDKPVHFVIYAVLGALVWWGIAPAGAAAAVALTFTVGALYGASDELHQLAVPGRTADISDWVADAAGIAAVALIALALSHRRARKDRR
jgi:VanZ family protein